MKLVRILFIISAMVAVGLALVQLRNQTRQGRYAISRKFIAAEGGLPRLVWMTKELKNALADGLRQCLLLLGRRGRRRPAREAEHDFAHGAVDARIARVERRGLMQPLPLVLRRQ